MKRSGSILGVFLCSLFLLSETLFGSDIPHPSQRTCPIEIRKMINQDVVFQTFDLLSPAEIQSYSGCRVLEVVVFARNRLTTWGRTGQLDLLRNNLRESSTWVRSRSYAEYSLTTSGFNVLGSDIQKLSLTAYDVDIYDVRIRLLGL